jgi:hypothetical protein
MAYNGLVQSWLEITRIAMSNDTAQAQPKKPQQSAMFTKE